MIIGARTATKEEWEAANNYNQAKIRLHPDFHTLVREVAVAEQPRTRRRDSPTHGLWCTRGMKSPRHDLLRRAYYFAESIAKDLFFDYWELAPNDATAMVYVTARDNVRARMR